MRRILRIVLVNDETNKCVSLHVLFISQCYWYSERSPRALWYRDMCGMELHMF